MKKIIIILLSALFSVSCTTTQNLNHSKTDASLTKAQSTALWTAVGVAAAAVVLGSKKSTKARPSNSIAAVIDNGTLRVSASDNHAGAICSLIWKGKEFIDCFDHGRLLQSAVSFNGLGEAFNPTEGGGEIAGHRSQLQSLTVTADNKTLKTKTRMSYWRDVDGVSLSNHVLHKSVELGYNGLNNVIKYDVQYDIPNDRPYDYGVFEALTAYMPRDFNTFYGYRSGSLTRLDVKPLDVNTEQPKPIIAATQDGRYAIALWSPDLPQGKLGYGPFLLQGDVPNIPKINGVFRVVNPSGSLHYRMFVIVGDLEQIRTTMLRMNVR